MLVLTRKLGENIRIGDAVKITVLEVRSGQVKLGIEAPPEVKVHREEIYARIQEENRKAAAQRPPSSGADPGKITASRRRSMAATRSSWPGPSCRCSLCLSCSWRRPGTSLGSKGMSHRPRRCR